MVAGNKARRRGCQPGDFLFTSPKEPLECPDNSGDFLESKQLPLNVRLLCSFTSSQDLFDNPFSGVLIACDLERPVNCVHGGVAEALSPVTSGFALKKIKLFMKDMASESPYLSYDYTLKHGCFWEEVHA